MAEQYQLFAALKPEEFTALEADIKKRGVMVPVERDGDGNILDGHHRVKIAEKLGISYRTITRRFKSENEKREHVIKLNLARRHLAPHEWGLAFAELLESKGVRRGKGKGDPSGKTATVAVLATEAGVSERTARWRLAQADAYTELPKKIRRKVDAGEKSLTQAKREAKAESIKKNPPKIPRGKHRVIYADPPWSYGNTQPDYHKEQRDHYPVMSLSEICELPVGEWSAENSVLFLWVTSPILEESFQVVRAWGFKYKTSFVWDKVKHNMGHYNSVRHEFLLVCVRGSCPPDVPKLFDSVITEERTEHSKKPDQVYSIIETIYTRGPYLELFARGKKRKGWRHHGNQ